MEGRIGEGGNVSPRTFEDAAIRAGQGRKKEEKGHWPAELCRATWGPVKEARGCGVWSELCLRPIRVRGRRTMLSQGNTEPKVCWCPGSSLLPQPSSSPPTCIDTSGNMSSVGLRTKASGDKAPAVLRKLLSGLGRLLSGKCLLCK